MKPTLITNLALLTSLAAATPVEQTQSSTTSTPATPTPAGSSANQNTLAGCSNWHYHKKSEKQGHVTATCGGKNFDTDISGCVVNVDGKPQLATSSTSSTLQTANSGTNNFVNSCECSAKNKAVPNLTCKCKNKSQNKVDSVLDLTTVLQISTVNGEESMACKTS